MRYLLLFLPVFLLTFLTQILQATTINVPGDEPTIQAGIDACVDGDTVLVADGTYTGDGNRDIDFGGRAIVVMSENGPEVTVIDCEEGGRGFSFHNGEGMNSVVLGFTISNGARSHGGGIYCDGSSPTITNCTFSGNTANQGGGMYNWDSSPTVTNCTFSGNTADRGGGMYNEQYSLPMVTNCTFDGNTATGVNSYGGGMDNNDASGPTIDNCTFSGNLAEWGGGGMCNWNSFWTTVTNCTFSGNTAGLGGGMYNLDSPPTVTNCTFSGNTAGRGGGMENKIDSNPTVTNCTFTGNSATDSQGGGMSNISNCDPTVTNCTFSNNTATGTFSTGGGMYNYDDSSPTVTNCTFSGNSAEWGGGMLNSQNSNPVVTNCTFTGNSATDGQGGGMANWGWSSDPTVTNCILWGDLGGEFYNEYDPPIVTYSDVQGGYTGEGNIDVPPRFADPEYHLQSTSPCIDAGDPSILDACIPPGRGEERSDMGAYGGDENCGWPEDPIEVIIDPTGLVLVARGDTLFFSTLVRNNGPNSVEGDYWLSVMLPDSSEMVIPSNYLNFANPISGQVAPSDSLVLSNELYVPGMAPIGGYTMIGRVGLYPNVAIDEWWLNFVVIE